MTDERDIPNPRLCRNIGDDPTGNRLTAKIAAIAPAVDVDQTNDIVFTQRIMKIEKRTQRVFKGESIGEAKVESQIESEEVPDGWWVSLEGSPVATRFSREPDLRVGDLLEVRWRVIKKGVAK